MRRLSGIFLVFALVMQVLCGADCTAQEAVKFEVSAIFGSSMVLQRDQPLPVWGLAQPGAEVSVTLGSNTATTKADEGGRWLAKLPAMPAGGPHKLVISGPVTVTFEDVLIGDVWVCSGQSNMQWSVQNSKDFEAEKAAANYPQLRHFDLQRATGAEPLTTLRGKWTVAAPENIGPWTAVGYFFGRDLQKAVNVPIGLINTSWGGTRVEAWMSYEELEKYNDFADELKRHRTALANIEANRAVYDQQKATYDKGRKELAALEKDEANQARLSAVDFDDSAWVELEAPRNWDEQGFKDVFGEGWYRKTIEIPADWAGKDLELGVGQVDEIDTTHFNGVKVGGMGSVEPFNPNSWNKDRVYSVPAALVKEGKAVVAVRVINLVGQGGLWHGEPEGMFLRLAGDKAQSIPLAGKWRFDFTFRLPAKPADPANQNSPAALFNAMINPIVGFPIKGAIWYQGESNAGNGYVYRDRFAGMITDWRARWGQGDFPFLWVQLANYQQPKDKPVADNWAVVRESQDKVLALPNTATALAIDVGEAGDIHPRDKQTVGARLALGARAVAYGEKELVYSGPRYKSAEFKDGKAVLSFDHIGGGLVAKGGELKRFAIAGEDQKWVWAQAVIDGDKVVVSSAEVANPVAVRYAYEINPEGANLYNAEGLPASPFRTDDWVVPTQPQK